MDFNAKMGDVITLQAEVGGNSCSAGRRHRLYQSTRCPRAAYIIQFVFPPSLLHNVKQNGQWIFNKLSSVSVPLDDRDVRETSYLASPFRTPICPSFESEMYWAYWCSGNILRPEFNTCPVRISTRTQSIRIYKRYRWFTQFTVHRYTRARILSLH
jgi:hypothetical protein